MAIVDPLDDTSPANASGGDRRPLRAEDRSAIPAARSSLPAVEPVRERIRTDLRAAMKARDRATVSTLRATLAAIENAEAVADDGRPVVEDARIAGSVGGLGAGEAPRAVVDEQAALAIVAREAQERRAAADEYDRLDRDDEADRLRREAELLEAFCGPAGRDA